LLLADADSQAASGVPRRDVVGIGLLRQLDDAPEGADEPLLRIGARVVAGRLRLQARAFAADGQQSLVDGQVQALRIDARRERNDLDRDVGRADVDLRERAGAPGTYAGREPAEQPRHLALQAVELAEKVGSEIDFTHGHFLLQTNRKTDRPTRSSPSAEPWANKSKHAARRTAGAAA